MLNGSVRSRLFRVAAKHEGGIPQLRAVAERMARRHLVGLPDRFRHHCDRNRTVRATRSQAACAGMDLASINRRCRLPTFSQWALRG